MNGFCIIMIQSMPHVIVDLDGFDMIYDSEYDYGYVCMYVCM